MITFTAGAVLDWAVIEPYQHGFIEPYQHGFSVNKVGWILMVVGVVGAVLSVVVMVVANTRRRHTVVGEGRGNVVRRVDSTF